MSPRIKFGLLAGLIGGALTLCVAPVFGLCGPFVGLLAGALGGFLTARNDPQLTQADGAKAGAIAGLVAGGFLLLAQMAGGIMALLYLQYTGADTAFGAIPSFSAPPAELVGYYVGGLATGVCLGLANAVASALAGAGAGFLGTTTSAPATPPASSMG